MRSTPPLAFIGVFVIAFFAKGFSASAQPPATLSVILVDGGMREDWPDPGVVGFHRKNTTGVLQVHFSLGGSSVIGTDYTVSVAAGNYTATPDLTITIPDGEDEAWIECAPTGKNIPTHRTITVNALPDSAYILSSNAPQNTATITLDPPSTQPCQKSAIRFLLQAAFGPDGSLTNVKEVQNLGFERWIKSQFNRPAGLMQPYLNRLNVARRGKVYADAKAVSWWNQVMKTGAASDPLRQRIAFALSEIFVISDHLDALSNQPIGMANYYDVLVKGAFGNFRDLLATVGMHPAMGTYLSSLQNEKPDPVAGTFADENFAREVMQLFSIGLWQLNTDGTQKLDANSHPIPTYDNKTITSMARVMTGFSWGGPKAKGFWDAPENYLVPMHMWDSDHDLDPKTIIGGITLPSRTQSNPDKGTAGMADYNAAIDALFNHPSCPPFICKQLIQRLVTSNPSPAYVGRVASAFIDNGSGVRGDMKAVILAILLDPEARDPAMITDQVFGKMKEPYLRTANLIRALDAHAANGVYALSYLDDIHFQQPLSARSVFNFFKPGYSPSGPVNDAGLVAPEFQILNSASALAVPSYHFEALSNGFNRWGSSSKSALVLPDLRPELALATDVPALLRHLDLLLTGGTLPKEQHAVIRHAVEQIQSGMWQWQQERVRMAITLIAGSPEYAILR